MNDNAISSRTIIKIKDASLYKNKLAEVKAFYKDILYVWMKGMLKESNGYYAVPCRKVVNAG